MKKDLFKEYKKIKVYQGKILYEKIKTQNGITLIALVISIIVMLILSGISLNAIIGDNGIITRAQESKLRKEEADVETEILSGVSALDMEYYEKVSSDSGITISSIYSISGLSKYVKGKINGFKYNKNGTTVVYYTNKNGSYTITIDKNGKATTKKGIDVATNQVTSIKLGKNETINLNENDSKFKWNIVSGNAVIDSKTGELTKNDDKTVIVSKKDENGNESTIIIKDNSNKNTTENNDISNAVENVDISNGIKAITVPKDDGTYKLIIRGKGTLGSSEELKEIAYVDEISEVVIEEGIEKIEGTPFVSLSNTSILTLPKSLKECEGVPFDDLENLEEINYNCTDLKWDIDKDNNDFNGMFTSQEKIELNIGEYVKNIPNNFFVKLDVEDLIIPDSVEKINDNAFYGSTLKYLVLGNNVQSVGKEAFYHIDAKNLFIPSNIQTIGEDAFIYCENLKFITFSEGLKNIGNGAFMDTAIEKLDLPNTLETIGDNAFFDCKNLKELNLNEGLKSIGESSFKSVAIKELKLPTTLEYISGWAFYGCNDIETLYYNPIHCSTEKIYDIYNDDISYYPFQADDNDDISKCYNIENIIIGDKVEYIDSDIFRKCNITTITIPSNVKYIAYKGGNNQSGEDGAFTNCSFLKEIIVKKSENSLVGAPWSNVSGITVKWEP